MVTLLQLILIRFLIFLDELPVPLQGIATLLEEFFEAQPQLVLVFGGNFSIKQVSDGNN